MIPNPNHTEIVTPFSGPIYTAEELRVFGRISSSETDAELDALIAVAYGMCETYARRAFCTQTVDFFSDEWPNCSELELPFSPAISVTSVKYKADTSGLYTTWSGSNYQVSTNAFLTRICPHPDVGMWPILQSGMLDAVNVRYEAGLAAAWSGLPDTIKHAVKLTAVHLYSNRGEEIAELPGIARQLLRPYRYTPL